ncbi:SpoIIE family protein phosphatase [Streptomyces sp. RLB3-17]|nr:SpoIIE family protein phosphatase [Streptomyces sp. RLB1-9]QDO25488.1 SpoIIE family protein phosphatase [Streptomyces sp. S1A1-8]QDO35607.1 SpoIIE family protein phosphatase [Streptomyces sp. S1A1-3]QDO45626.1 SpoIIE family protein phosphatase [Streptomyces sp. RLB3-17]
MSSAGKTGTRSGAARRSRKPRNPHRNSCRTAAQHPVRKARISLLQQGEQVKAARVISSSLSPLSVRPSLRLVVSVPPVLVHPGGSSTCSTRPPTPRPAVSPPPGRTAGDTLVLYTDGLVERRGEDIDVGLRRLTDTLTRHTRLAPERLADMLLARLGVSSGGRDEVALVVVRL